MDDSQAMGIGQRLGQLRGDLRDPPGGKKSLGHHLGQATSLDQGHRDVMTVAVAASLVDWHDPGVAKPCQGAGLSQKPLQGTYRGSGLLTRYLQRHLTLEQR